MPPLRTSIRNTVAGPVCSLLAVAVWSGALPAGDARPEGGATHGSVAGPASATWELTGGRWFDGEGFVQERWFIVSGRLTRTRPMSVDSTRDLSGLWLVPPFGEAHNHNLEDSRLDAVASAYLDAGIFYVKNPDAIPRFVERARSLASRIETVDGVFAQGGWTGPGGHPVELFERNLERGIFREEDGEGAFFRVAASAKDVHAKWDDFLADRPDFVKAYLLYSELAPDSLPHGWRGLGEDALSAVVARAHASGLRVTVHVETAADFRTAVRLGADEIAHLPGFRSGPGGSVPDMATHGLTIEDSRLAAERGVVVVTTASFVSRAEGPADAATRWREVVEHNLATLRDAGVTLAIGSDDYGRTSRAEAVWLASLEVFDNAEVLRMWSVATPRAVFPGRPIGVFEEGGEASFLGLRADPLADFEATGNIALRFKQGYRLMAEPGP